MINNNDDDFDVFDSLLAEETQPLPMGPQGFAPILPIQPEPIPEATKENMICLRDCKFFMQIDSRFQHGNTKGTLTKEPVQFNRFCKAIPGTEIDLTDELVRECSDWDPIPLIQIKQRETRRNKWLKENNFTTKKNKGE